MPLPWLTPIESLTEISPEDFIINKENELVKFGKTEMPTREELDEMAPPEHFHQCQDYEVEKGPRVHDMPWCRYETQYIYTLCMYKDLSETKFIFQ